MNDASDLDLSNPDSFAAGFPHDHFRRLRSEDPVHWHEGDVHGGPGYWVVSKYDDVKWVSKNPGLFASGQGNLIEEPLPGAVVACEVDAKCCFVRPANGGGEDRQVELLVEDPTVAPWDAEHVPFAVEHP